MSTMIQSPLNGFIPKWFCYVVYCMKLSKEHRIAMLTCIHRSKNVFQSSMNKNAKKTNSSHHRVSTSCSSSSSSATFQQPSFMLSLSSSFQRRHRLLPSPPPALPPPIQANHSSSSQFTRCRWGSWGASSTSSFAYTKRRSPCRHGCGDGFSSSSSCCTAKSS